MAAHSKNLKLVRINAPAARQETAAMRNTSITQICALLAFLGLAAFDLPRPAGAADPAPASTDLFQTQIVPLLDQYCFRCHAGDKPKADLNLKSFLTTSAVIRNRATWDKVLHHVRTREMPPSNKPQPTAEERVRFTDWIEQTLAGSVDCNHPDPGRVTLRRLNRAEYNNTIRDLTGVDFQPGVDFPPDDTGYGFDNIGDVLSLSPLLLEKYIAAAEHIVATAIVADPSTNAPIQRLQAEDFKSTAVGGIRQGPGGAFRELMREGETYTPFTNRQAGTFLLRVRAYGDQAGPEPPKLELRLDDAPLRVWEVPATERNPAVLEHRIQLAEGEHKLAAAYLNNYVNQKDPNPDNRDRNLLVDYLEILGPLGSMPLPESHQRLLFKQPTPDTRQATAREILARFARRAFRRPLRSGELDRLFQFLLMVEKDRGSFERGLQLAFQATLVSPQFLFRGEPQPDPNNPKAIYRLDDYALASRLSYFLWSSMPDDTLFELAEKGRLRKNLEAQVQRMVADPKARALVQNFAGQWLQLRNLDLVMPDRLQFKDFNDDLRADMRRETELFFETVLRENRSVLELITADYTFLNERLARHYGMEGVHGDQFQRVSLKGTPRGGILTHASVLTITSNPTRTSPVKRGLYVLDNILGTPPPPPPPNVPPLKEVATAELTGTLRQRMEQHRTDPLCASCHARMDPIGFGLENFNAVGQWRTHEGPFAIDPAGQLTSGEAFQGPEALRSILAGSKKEEFVGCLVSKMLTYALGRGLEYYDRCAVDEISRDLAKHQYRFHTLIHAITRSVPFQFRRGETAGALTPES